MRPFWLLSIESDWRIGDHSFLIEKLPFLQESINTLSLHSFLSPPACDLSRTVCAKLFPIWTEVIDHFPARFAMAKALVSRGFPSLSGA